MFDKKRNKRIIIASLTGAVLGIFCIIGVGSRLGFAGNWFFLLAVWYNRVIMGLIIGIIPDWKFAKGKYNTIVRGAVFGLLVSGSFYLATGFLDPIGFFAGIVYGMIIDYVATKYA